MNTSAEAIWKEMLTLYPTREVVLLLCMQSNRKAKLCFYILLAIIIMFQGLFLYQYLQTYRSLSLRAY